MNEEVDFYRVNEAYLLVVNEIRIVADTVGQRP